MGNIGSSVKSLFPHSGSGDEIVRFLNSRDPAIDVRRGHDAWLVLTGDQVLFESVSREGCSDFLLGLMVGGTLFPHLAEWASERQAAWAALFQMMRNGRVYVKAAAADGAGKAQTSPATEQAMAHVGVEEFDGKRIGVYTDGGMVAEATAEYDGTTGHWTFHVDASTLRHEDA